MAIRWRGYGYLGFMIPVAIWGLIAIVWRGDNWPAVRIGLVISAILVWVIGSRLNSEGPDDDGEVLHQTFGFPMQWSGLALCLFGLFLTL
jgi:hypothetical protein